VHRHPEVECSRVRATFAGADADSAFAELLFSY
jgi:hypothetical protein